MHLIVQAVSNELEARPEGIHFMQESGNFPRKEPFSTIS